MANSIKYSTTGDTQSLKKGNLFFGTGDVGKGPSSVTQHYNGVTPMGGGYTIYFYDPRQPNNIGYDPISSDVQLIRYTNGISGQNFTGATQCFNWYATQTNYTCVNEDYDGIVTSGLTLNLDASFLSSYPKSGTTWYDLSYSGYNGTLTNGPIYSGDGGGTFIFDGVDDYVDPLYTTPIGTNDFSYSVWVKYTASQIGAIMAKRLGSPTFEQFSLFVAGDYYGNTAGTYIACDDYKSGGRYVNTVNTYGDGNWHYVVVTRNSTGVLIYVDGVSQTLIGTNGGSTPNLSIASKLFIGCSGDNQTPGGIPFNGSITLVQAYNRAISAQEVRQNYNAGLARFNTSNVVKSGLILNLDASNTVSYLTTGTTWTDLSGNGYHGTLTNGPTFNSTSKSIVFDGVDDYVTCGNSVGNFGTSNFTINFLFRTTETTFPATFLAKSIGDSPTTDYGWLVNNGSDGTNLGFAIATTNLGWGNSGSYVIQTSGATINNGVWQMATIVGDKSQSSVSIYLNGVLKNLKSYVTTTAAFNTIGNVTNTRSLMVGSESDIGVSPFPIDASIRSVMLYNKALSQSEVLQNFYGGPIVTSGLVMYLDAGNLVSYSGAGTTWYDLTTNGNNATFYNGVGFSSTNGGGIVFDGVDDYAVVLANSSLNSSQPTVELIMTTTTNGGNIIAQGQYGSNWGFGVGVKLSTILARNNSGDSSFSVSNSGLVHVVVVWDGSGNQFYKNGVFLGRTTTNYSPNPGGQVTIGGVRSQVPSQNLQEFANSTVSVVRIYNRALTADEISQNFNATKSRFGI